MLTTPDQERQARAATKSAEKGAEIATQAQADLPLVESNAQDMLTVLDQLEKSDGLKWIFGARSVAPIVPGTPQADAFALWEQVQGKAFLQAFGSLKGGGQITEVEGKKATAAITRLSNRAQSEESARQAMNELKGIVRRGVGRARQQAKSSASGAGSAQPQATKAPSEMSDAELMDALKNGNP